MHLDNLESDLSNSPFFTFTFLMTKDKNNYANRQLVHYYCHQQIKETGDWEAEEVWKN